MTSLFQKKSFKITKTKRNCHIQNKRFNKLTLILFIPKPTKTDTQTNKQKPNIFFSLFVLELLPGWQAFMLAGVRLK